MDINSKKYLVERSNDFNNYRPYGLTLSEIRFFSIYQARINARNIDNREVILSLNEFIKIMNLKRINITWIKKIANDLVSKTVTLPNDDGTDGFTVIPLFSRFKVYNKKNSSDWCVSIKCSEELVPYLFHMKSKYFKYELWNALTLTSPHQVRLYEILKQYEKIGIRIIALTDLKLALGLDATSYSAFGEFKRRILDFCQNSFRENTDILFDYEKITKPSSRKVVALKFNIYKNKDFKDTLQIDEFIKDDKIIDLSEYTLLDDIERDTPKKSSKEYDEIISRDIIDIDAYEVSPIIETSPSFEPSKYDTEEDSAEKKHQHELDYTFTACEGVFTKRELEVIWNIVERTMVHGNYDVGSYIIMKYYSIQSKLKGGTIVNKMPYILKLIDTDVKALNK